MDERKHLTLLYVFDEKWIGGTYYILNIVRAFKVLLNDQFRPRITVIYQYKTDIKELLSIEYPYIDYIEINFHLSLLKQAINIIAKNFINKNIFEINLPIKKIDFLYPLDVFINTDNIKNASYWIPDFQERYLPQFFIFYQVIARHLRTLLMIKSGYPIVFSSFTALNDFKKYYQNAKNKTVVIPFVSIIAKNCKNNYIKVLKHKYNLPDSYFICSNQFWRHKNHIVIFNAIKILKEMNIKTKVIFTGKEYDYRNRDYFVDLKKYIKKIDIADYLVFLGFIRREDQIQIMNNSLCIIQPSFFEGWSTVVEDSKALNKYILVSDIPIHREQIQSNCIFFNPEDYNDLANKMIQCLKNKYVAKYINYDFKVQEFAMNIINLISKTI